MQGWQFHRAKSLHQNPYNEIQNWNFRFSYLQLYVLYFEVKRFWIWSSMALNVSVTVHHFHCGIGTCRLDNAFNLLHLAMHYWFYWNGELELHNKRVFWCSLLFVWFSTVYGMLCDLKLHLTLLKTEHKQNCCAFVVYYLNSKKPYYMTEERLLNVQCGIIYNWL